MCSFSFNFFPKDQFHCPDLKDVIGITSPAPFKSLMMELVFLMVGGGGVSGFQDHTPQAAWAACGWAMGPFMPRAFYQSKLRSRTAAAFMNLGKWAPDDYEVLNLGTNLIGTVQPQGEPRVS